VFLANRSIWNRPFWSRIEKHLASLEALRLNPSPGESQGPEPEANVDRGELSKFEAAAPQWWDPKGASGALHAINPLRLGFVQSHGQVKNQKVLDVGCGGGLLTEALSQAGARVTGIDRGRTALAVAREHARGRGLTIDYRQATAESWAAQYPGRYDVVTCMELLEHVPDPQSVIRACTTLVKAGGNVIFATLNRNPKSYLFAILGAEYLLGLLPPGTHDWRRFIPPEALAGWAEDAGLTLSGASGLTYNPFITNYRLAGDMSVNYLLAFQKPAISRNCHACRPPEKA
jgi:2-polyprenyl-6-hydroxyphenyl methylase/3-demethylubiquinone-9 3-methyltransferase